MEKHIQLEYFVPHEKEGHYLTLPFQMPENIAEFSLSYHYQKDQVEPIQVENGTFLSSRQINILDLGLVGPNGEQVGASGSDKSAFTLSALDATPGYTPTPLTAGEWQIIVGAYKIAPEGVNVIYDLTFTPKSPLHLRGDIHTHTHASDGVLSASELAVHALRHGLDFLAITDHNQIAKSDQLPRIAGITLIPGVEWTHYQGHANFLGTDQPYDEPFFTNTPEDARSRFVSARERGALIIINHPFGEGCEFQFDLNQLTFDCMEIWNGPMRESNLRAVGLWQSLLANGKKIPAVGGSDYHRDNLFQILGGPCMGVYALSRSREDILSALRAGHSYITFAPQGPQVEISAGDAIMGDSVNWQPGTYLSISAQGLQNGDILRAVTAQDCTDVFQATSDGKVTLEIPIAAPGFMRIEIHRTFLPGIPPLPALISNPIYFDSD